MIRRAAVCISFAVLAFACVVDRGIPDEPGLAPQGTPNSVATVPTLTPVPTGLPPLAPADRRVNVYWHVIRNGTGTAQGNITDAQIESQMAVLNAAFEPRTFYFHLES